MSLVLTAPQSDVDLRLTASEEPLALQLTTGSDVDLIVAVTLIAVARDFAAPDFNQTDFA